MESQAYGLTSDVLRYHFISDFILDVNPSQGILDQVLFQARVLGKLES